MVASQTKGALGSDKRRRVTGTRRGISGDRKMLVDRCSIFIVCPLGEQLFLVYAHGTLCNKWKCDGCSILLIKGGCLSIAAKECIQLVKVGDMHSVCRRVSLNCLLIAPMHVSF